MKCYLCGANLDKGSYCPNCNTDVALYKKVIYKSNALYNDGLNKARIRDIEGATDSLNAALKLNKKNTPARNLLGLCYFETGEVMKALSEWIISKSLDPDKGNIAYVYIEKLQGNQSRLSTYNQSIKNFNQALMYVRQGNPDLALIQLKKILSLSVRYVKAYQLAALIYMETGEYDKARRALLKALRIDAGNTLTKMYLKETNNALREMEEASPDKNNKKSRKLNPSNDIYSYSNGNDVIIQPVYEKEKAGFSSMINIVIGLIMGVLVCWFLVVPARIEKEKLDADVMFKQVSDELSAETASHKQDATALENLTKEREELVSKIEYLEGKSGELRPEDYLIEAASKYIANPDSSAAIMETLNNITSEDLQNASETFNNLYTKLKGSSGPKMLEDYIETARNCMKANDYEGAIEQYTKAYELNKNDSDILMSLAHAYRQKGDTDKADELYKKVIKDFEGTQNAADAMDYITNQ